MHFKKNDRQIKNLPLGLVLLMFGGLCCFSASAGSPKRHAALPKTVDQQELARRSACQTRLDRLEQIYLSERINQGFVFLSLHSAVQDLGDFLRRPPAPPSSGSNQSPRQAYLEYERFSAPNRDKLEPKNTGELVDDLERPVRTAPLRVMGQIIEAWRTLGSEIQLATQRGELSPTERSSLKQKIVRTLHAILVTRFLQSRISAGSATARGIGAVFSGDPSRDLENSLLRARPVIRSEEADFFVDRSNQRDPVAESTPAYRILPRYRTHIALEKDKAWLTLCTSQNAIGCVTLDLRTGREITFHFPNEELRNPLAVRLGQNKRVTTETRDPLDDLESQFYSECQGLTLQKERDGWGRRMLSASDQDFERRFLGTDPTYFGWDFREMPLPAPESVPTTADIHPTADAAQ